MISNAGISSRTNPFKGDAYQLLRSFEDRVEADGGTIDSMACTLNSFRLNGYDFWYNYQQRVTTDGGVAESQNCFKTGIRSLK